LFSRRSGVIHLCGNIGRAEASTKKGHGLYAIDGKTKWMDGLIVDVISNGLFPRRLRCQK
jgi:hypothetical protein